MVDSQDKAKPVGRAQIIAVGVVAILLFGGFEIQKHREGTPAPRAEGAVISLTGPEARLTAIQLGERPDHVNSTMKRFAALFDILGADCPATTRGELADLTVRSIRELTRSKIEATPTQVLGGVLGSSDIGSVSGCSPFFERYVALRRAT